MFRKIGGTMGKNAHIDKKRLFMSGGITGALVVALGAGMWALYPKGGTVAQGDVANAPVIQADATPYKTIPDDPGGMEIPHRESRVFEVLNADGEEIVPEKTAAVLPETEEPMERDEIFAQIEREIDEETATGKPEGGARVVAAPTSEHEVIKPDIPEELLAKIEKGEIKVKADSIPAASSAGEKSGSEDSGTSSASRPIRISVSGGDGSKKEILINDSKKQEIAAEDNRFDSFEPEMNAETVPVAKTVTAREDDSAGKAAARTEPAAGGIAAEAVNVAKKHFVQLGSVQSEAASAKEWGRLQRAYGDVISGLDYRVQRADLGDRGIYYRIQGGPLTEEQARTICEDITAQKPGGCLVIKP